LTAIGQRRKVDGMRPQLVPLRPNRRFSFLGSLWWLVEACFIVGIVWPLQLVCYVTVWTLQGATWLFRYAGYQYMIRNQAKS
jgi:hypothetical protein